LHRIKATLILTFTPQKLPKTKKFFSWTLKVIIFFNNFI
jgi:hypothetical protein